MTRTAFQREDRRPPASLRARLLALIGLLCLPLFALLWHAQTQGYRREAVDMEQDVLRLSEVVAGNVEQMFDSTRQLLIAVTAVYHLSDPATHGALLQELSEGWPFVMGFGVATPDGEILCAASPGMNTAQSLDASLLQRALERDGIVVGTLRVDVVGTRDALSVAYRASPTPSATDAAVGFAMIDFAWLDYLLAAEKVTGKAAISRKHAIMTILDSWGVILGRFPENERWMGRQVGPSAFFRALQAHLGGDADVVDIDGRERFHTFRRVRSASNDVYVSVGVSRQSALAAARSSRKTVVAGFAVVVAILGAGAWYGVQAMIVRPVAALTDAMRRLRGRASGARAHLIGGPREIVELGRAFDDMARSIEEYEGQLRETTLELSLAEDEERRRIAEGLHEHTGPLLASCYMKLGRAAKARDGTIGARMIEEVRQLLDRAITQTQSLTFHLSSPTLHTLGLNAALDQLCQEYRVEHGLGVVFRGDGVCQGLSDSHAVVLYQAARELLRNVVKHTHARRVTLRSIRDEAGLTLEVTDDGMGFDAGNAGRRFGKSGGFGLFNLRERFAHLGGRLDVQSKPGKGTRATVFLPIGKADRATKEGTP